MRNVPERRCIVLLSMQGQPSEQLSPGFVVLGSSSYVCLHCLVSKCGFQIEDTFLPCHRPRLDRVEATNVLLRGHTLIAQP